MTPAPGAALPTAPVARNSRSRSGSPQLDANAPAFLPTSAAAAASAANAAARSHSNASSSNLSASAATASAAKQAPRPATSTAATKPASNKADQQDPQQPSAKVNGVADQVNGTLKTDAPPLPRPAPLTIPARDLTPTPTDMYPYGPGSYEHPHVPSHSHHDPYDTHNGDTMDPHAPSHSHTHSHAHSRSASGFHPTRERRSSNLSIASHGAPSGHEIPSGSGAAASGDEAESHGAHGAHGGQGLSRMLEFIQQNKLAGNRPLYPAGGGPGAGRGLHGGRGAAPHERDPKWVQPSGPRRPGEGVENEEQGIVSADKTAQGMILRITLLAAGFVIGPSGSSVRDIMRMTGADVKSWTENRTAAQLMAAAGGPGGAANGGGGAARRPCRVVVVEGEEGAVLHAVNVIVAAVDRYKDLCEGKYQGQAVPRLQRVLGVDFSYQPPPRSVVPCAAALKGQSTPADHHQAHHGHVPPPHHAHAHGPRGPPGMDRGALHMGGSRGRPRDEYGHYSPGGSSSGGYPGPGPGGYSQPPYHMQMVDPYGTGAPYMVAVPASPIAHRGHHGDPYAAYGRSYDSGGSLGSPAYGPRYGQGPPPAHTTGSSSSRGPPPAGGPTKPPSASVPAPLAPSGSSGNAPGPGGGPGHGSSSAYPTSSHQPQAQTLAPMGSLPGLDLSGMGAMGGPGGLQPLPMPPGSPGLTLMPGMGMGMGLGGPVGLSMGAMAPGTDMAAIADYYNSYMKGQGFLPPGVGALMPLDMATLAGGGAFAPMDPFGLSQWQQVAQLNQFMGLPGLYYPLPGAPLSPLPGSPTRGGSGGRGGGQGPPHMMPPHGGHGGASSGPMPPSPSRLNPLAQPWSAPFMSSAPRDQGGPPADAAHLFGGPAAAAAPPQPQPPPPILTRRSPNDLGAGGDGEGGEDGGEDDLSASVGEEVAMAAAERALANKTPKRPAKAPSDQNPLAPLPAGPPAIKTTSDPGGGGAADASGPAGGPDQTPPGAPSRDSPTPTPPGDQLVSAGDPLVSPTRFSANKGGGRRGARGLRRSYPNSPTHQSAAAASAPPSAGPTGGGGGSGISRHLAGLPELFSSKFAVADDTAPDVASHPLQQHTGGRGLGVDVASGGGNDVGGGGGGGDQGQQQQQQQRSGMTVPVPIPVPVPAATQRP